MEEVSDLPILYEQVFGRKVDVNYFLEKYNAARLGNVFYGCCAYDGSLLVGYTGVRIRELSWCGETRLSGESVDSMVHVEYRGNNLYRNLIEACQKILVSEGIPTFWGVPNEGSGHVLFNHVKWKRGVELHRYMVPVQSRFLSLLMRLLSRSIRKGDAFMLFRTDKQPTPSFDQDQVITLKREERVALRRGFLLELEGLCFWVRVHRSVLYLGDMDTPDSPEHFKKGMAALQGVAKKAGLTEIIFQTAPGSRLETLFNTCYPIYPSWTLAYQNLGDGWDLDHMRLTWGDLDTFEP